MSSPTDGTAQGYCSILDEQLGPLTEAVLRLEPTQIRGLLEELRNALADALAGEESLRDREVPSGSSNIATAKVQSALTEGASVEPRIIVPPLTPSSAATQDPSKSSKLRRSKTGRRLLAFGSMAAVAIPILLVPPNSVPSLDLAKVKIYITKIMPDTAPIVDRLKIWVDVRPDMGPRGTSAESQSSTDGVASSEKAAEGFGGWGAPKAGPLQKAATQRVVAAPDQSAPAPKVDTGPIAATPPRLSPNVALPADRQGDERAHGSLDVAVSAIGADVAAPMTRAVPTPLAGDIEALIRRGDQLIKMGDVASARLFYQRAAAESSADAARRVAETYDPLFLAAIGAKGMRGDPKQALSWYRRASTLGDPDATKRLTSLLLEYPE